MRFRGFRQGIRRAGGGSRKMGHPEHQHQANFNYLVGIKYPDLCWTATAGGEITHAVTRIAMNRAGYKKGCPDILIFEPRGQYHGLAIEMKAPALRAIDPITGKSKVVRKPGQVMEHQKDFLDRMRSRGYKAEVAYGSEEALEILDVYMGWPKVQ